jgi:hypothetical protein
LIFERQIGISQECIGIDGRCSQCDGDNPEGQGSSCQKVILGFSIDTKVGEHAHDEGNNDGNAHGNGKSWCGRRNHLGTGQATNVILTTGIGGWPIEGASDIEFNVTVGQTLLSVNRSRPKQ